MSDHITADLVDNICRRAVETDPVSPTTWESVDPMVRHMMRERATEFLGDVIPALLDHHWRPPIPITDIPF